MDSVATTRSVTSTVARGRPAPSMIWPTTAGGADAPAVIPTADAPVEPAELDVLGAVDQVGGRSCPLARSPPNAASSTNWRSRPPARRRTRRRSPGPRAAGWSSRNRCRRCPARGRRGTARAARRRCSLASSADRVVCIRYATLSGSARAPALATSAAVWTRAMAPRRLAERALDLLVPGVPDEHDQVALGREPPRLDVHLGDQRAGRVDRVQAAAEALGRTAGETPCAENTTVAPSGTSSSSSTKTAPRRSSSATTCVLCTICLRT